METRTQTVPSTIGISSTLEGFQYFKPAKRLRQYFMLEALARQGLEGLTQRTLGRLAGLSPAVVNQYLLEFSQQGLIRETFQLFQHGKEELGRVLQEHQRRFDLRTIVFYSAGQVTEVLLQALEKTTLRLLAIVDDDPAKQGKPFFGYPVIARDDILRLKPKPDAVIVTTFRYRDQICENLKPVKAQGIHVLGF